MCRSFEVKDLLVMIHTLPRYFQYRELYCGFLAVAGRFWVRAFGWGNFGEGNPGEAVQVPCFSPLLIPRTLQEPSESFIQPNQLPYFSHKYTANPMHGQPYPNSYDNAVPFVTMEVLMLNIRVLWLQAQQGR